MATVDLLSGHANKCTEGMTKAPSRSSERLGLISRTFRFEGKRNRFDVPITAREMTYSATSSKTQPSQEHQKDEAQDFAAKLATPGKLKALYG